jgi:hypothetical protein
MLMQKEEKETLYTNIRLDWYIARLEFIQEGDLKDKPYKWGYSTKANKLSSVYLLLKEHRKGEEEI